MENLYATFDARVVQELEQRDEFDFCSGGCIGSILEIGGGAAAAFFGGPGGGVVGGIAITDGLERINNGACS